MVIELNRAETASGVYGKEPDVEGANDLYVAAWDRTWKLAKGWDFCLFG